MQQPHAAASCDLHVGMWYQNICKHDTTQHPGLCLHQHSQQSC